MSYITPIYQNRDEAVAYILAIPHTGFKPNPDTGAVFNAAGVTWHNTGVPSLATYEAYSATLESKEGANLDHYYRDVEHWHAGPHFLATPDHIIVLGDLQADGVHCTCTNRDHYGVETIGDYRPGSDDPNSPGGKAAIANAANVIASLCIRFGWDPHKAVGFHRDCPNDHHPCPGPLLTNEFAIELVVARIAEIKADPKFFPHAVESTVPEVPVSPSVSDAPVPIVPHQVTVNADVFATTPAKATNYKGTIPFITQATELPTSFPKGAKPSTSYGDVEHNAPPEATHTPKEHYVDPIDDSPSHVQILSTTGGVTVTLVPTHPTTPTIKTSNPTVVVVK